MSIKTWQKEFAYSKAKRVQGLSKKNLEKHKVTAHRGKLHELKRVKSVLVPRSAPVFLQFDNATDEQKNAYRYWLKTNDCEPLVQSFKIPILKRLLQYGSNLSS